MNLVFNEFLETSIGPLISVLYANRYHDSPLKNFCLTVPKNFIEEPFCVSKNIFYPKMLGMRGGGYHAFPSVLFLSHSTEKLRRGTIACFTKFLVSKKFMDMRGEGGGGEEQDFLWKTFYPTVPKKFVGEPFRVSLISGIEKFYASEGYVTIFRRKFFVSQYRKTS